jgi:hypothetical protein
MQDGATVRDHLLQVAKITGSIPPELIEPELLPGCDVVWQMFLSLHNGRDGENKPISWRDLYAWQQIQNLSLDVFEIDLLIAMDRAALAALKE